jgi:hypothetical protein
MRNLYFIVSFLVLFCTTVFSQITGPKVGEVVGQMGTTWNERDGETQNTSMGYELQMKDFLQTGEDGGMILNYVDGTKFTMGPGTELIIDQFAFDTSVVPIELAMNVSVNVGSFTYESGSVSNLGGEVNIDAGNATITVQGTAFSGTVTPSGETTITLLPDSNGAVGQVTVSNDAGSQTITNAYNSVTVISNDLTPTPPKIETNKSDIIQLDELEKEIKEDTSKSFGDVDKKSDMSKEESKAQDMEEALINEDANIVEDNNTIVATDMSVSEADSMIETESKEEKNLDSAAVEAEVDTSYYDQWEEDLKEWDIIDENNEISVWDADGEKKMDWDDAKSMYAEMDQAYFDAIGCSDCTWDTIDWDNVNWDEVDWDAYDEAYNETLEKYGLASYNATVEEVDVVEETKDETEAGVKGYTWEDFAMDDDYYSNAEYNNNGGPPELTKANYCDYNGYDSSWCNQEHLDWLNDWYSDDWKLKVTYDSWTKESKKLFAKYYGWCGTYPDYEMCADQPKPWKIKDLKDKYISDWTWDDWDIYWQKVNDWYYAGWEEEQAEDNWEDEYAYEDDYDIDAELEQWLADVDNQWDCEYYGYYWDKANSACGTEWVDNSAAETEVTSSGETLNYLTGEVTQTLTTTDGVTGATSSSTGTGRVSTLNNEFDATASTSGDYTILNRYNDNHRSYIKTETANEADIQILQDKEAQHLDVGNSESQNNITIIQTD